MKIILATILFFLLAMPASAAWQVIGISQGGTEIPTKPALDEILIGNALSGYDLTTYSSLWDTNFIATTTWSGNLLINGSATTTDRFQVGNQFSVNTSTPSAGFELTVQGDGIFSGNLFVEGNLDILGVTTIGTTNIGATSMVGDLNITGFASTTAGLFTQGTLHVGGAATFDNIIIQIDDLSDALTVTSGVSNIFMGSGTGNSTTVGDFNTGIGIGVMPSIASTCGANECDLNTGVGFEALNDLTTGFRNVALGYRALTRVNSGQGNVALGYLSQQLLTTGSGNIGIGSASLNTNISGISNTGVGFQVLFSNTGSNNSAYGRDAMQTNIGGARNVAFGERAGFGTAATGDQNTWIGYRSGHGITSGDDNIMIGFQAGDITTTGSRNIIIGKDTDAPAAGTDDHLNIGDTIFADLSAGFVGIGTDTPTEALEIVGNLAITGTAPSVSLCGTTFLITGSSGSGRVRIGSGTITSCTLTFAVDFASIPNCVLTSDTTGYSLASNETVSTLVITSSADMATDIIKYHCF